jgi:hypothetical protein
MSNKKSDSKKKNKELVEQAAERLTEILIMYIEHNRRNRKNKKM